MSSERRLYAESFATPIGVMVALSDDAGALRAVDWQDYEARMHRLLRLQYPGVSVRLVSAGKPSAARKALERYFEGDLAAIDRIETRTGGTDFQREVWAALRGIAAGTTATYGALAARIGRPQAPRAVGFANGSNPIGVVMPCHRVIGANGSLTGYGGGMARKRWLLSHEGID